MCFSKRTKRSDFMKVKDFFEFFKATQFVIQGDSQSDVKLFDLESFGQASGGYSLHTSFFPFIFKALSIGDQVKLNKDKVYKKIGDLDADILEKEIITITQIKLKQINFNNGYMNQSQITFLIKE